MSGTFIYIYSLCRPTPRTRVKSIMLKSFNVSIVNSPMTAIPRITSVLFLGSLFTALNKKIK
jgi:hypothetical protein